MSDKNKSTLTYIQEMFKDKVDEEVINLVLTECQYNVEKTVMHLLNLTSESMINKTKVARSSTSHKLDDIDPVDSPLPVMPQCFSPATKDLSELLPKTQYSDVCTTKPLSLHDNPSPGTARPVFPNYLASENENLFGAKRISPTVTNVQSDLKLGSGFTENEMYISDDDIDEHIDSIDTIDPVKIVDKNFKVNYNSANRSNVKDKKIVKNVEQNMSKNATKSVSSDHQSFLNDRSVRPNIPQQKQVSLNNDSRTFIRPSFGPRFSFTHNQASYFANQAQYFPTFASSSFPHPFIQPRGSTPPMQYQRPPFPAFRPPLPHHFPPTRPMTYGSKAPSHSVLTTSMAGGNKGTNHSSIESVIPHGDKEDKHPSPTGSINNNAKEQNQPPLATNDTDGDEESKHPRPTSSMTIDSKGCNQPALTTAKTYGKTGSSHLTPTSATANVTKGPNQSPLTTIIGSKGSSPPITVTSTHNSELFSPPIPVTSTNTSKLRCPPIPVTSVHTSKGLSPPIPVTSVHTSKEPSPPIPVTSTHASGPPSHLIPTTSTRDNKFLNFPAQAASKAYGSKGVNNSEQTTSVSYGNRALNHMHKGYGRTQTRMQAKFPSYETKSLIILRGLPGSGKSTLARHLAAKGGMIISTDDYFTKGNRYSFNPEELSEAHEWNQNRAKAFMEAGFGPLIVDNTNTQAWEMRPYVLTGLKCGYEVEIKEPETWWKWNIKELERRNCHDVTANSLEKMLVRYEKNVTVDKIVKTAGQPITPSKSRDGGESNENTGKRKTDNKHEITSSGNKPLTENEKLPKANGKSEPKRSSSTKKAISLSANFSSPLDHSKRSSVNRGSKKQGNKPKIRMTTVRDKSDVPAKSADIYRSSESTIKHNLGVAPADVSLNKSETSENVCVAQNDVSSEITLNASLKSEFDNEASSNKGDSGLRDSLETDTRASKSIQPGDSLGDNAHLQDISHEDNTSKSEPKDNILPGYERSLLDVHTLVAEYNSESSPSQQAFKDACTQNIIKNEETYAELDISDSQQTLSDSEHFHSEKSTSVEPDVQKPRNEDVTDLRSDSNSHPRDISDGELIESFTRKKQKVDLDNSDRDRKCVNIDKEAVNFQVFNQSDDIPVKTNTGQCLNNGLSLTESGSLLPCLVDYPTCIQTEVPDEDYKDIKFCADARSPLRKVQKLTTDSPSPSIDLHHLKVETQTATTIEKRLCADIPMIDTSDFNIDVDNKNSNSTVLVEGDKSCVSNITVARDPNCEESQPKSSLDVLGLKTNIPDVSCCAQEYTQNSDTELSEVDRIISHDSDVITTSPSSDVRSDSELDIPNTAAVSVRESSRKPSGIDHQSIHTPSCSSMDTVREEPITPPEFSCKTGASTTVDRSTEKHSSNNDLEQASCKNANTVDCVGSEMDAVDVNAHVEMGNPLMDGTKAKLNENFEIVDTSVKSEDSDMLSPAAGKNDTLDPVQFLKDCFPLTEIDILKSFLNSCDGDLLKTVDSLLEYNESDYQSVTSVYDDTKHEESPRETLGINSPGSLSIPSAENSLQDHSVSPNVNRVKNQVLTPEHRNSYGTLEGTSPISGSTSTPKKYRDNFVQSLQLTLDPALALQLLEMFGAFSGVSAKDFLSESDRSVKVDKEFAKILYTRWRKSVQARNKAKKAEEPKKFSPGIGSPDGNTRRKFKTPPRQFFLPDSVPEKPAKAVVPQTEPVSFKEIMDEQFAIDVSESDQQIEKRSVSFVEEQLDLSTKLKRSRLHGMFPGVDAVALNEIFQANNYDLDTTIMQVQSSCGMPVTGKLTDVSQDQSFTNHQPSSIRQIDFEPEHSTEFRTDVDGNFQSLNDPSYHDYRAEALTHFELRKECIKKAALAYNKRQGELAKIYAEQAAHHGEKMKEANRRAAEKILESRNRDLMHSNTLDLHELHVNEAIQVLDNVLEERKKERRSTPNKKSLSYIEVITGRGNRSRDGKPRIKPAVMDYLRRKGYRYEELNSGLYKVFLN